MPTNETTIKQTILTSHLGALFELNNGDKYILTHYGMGIYRLIPNNEDKDVIDMNDYNENLEYTAISATSTITNEFDVKTIYSPYEYISYDTDMRQVIWYRPSEPTHNTFDSIIPLLNTNDVVSSVANYVTEVADKINFILANPEITINNNKLEKICELTCSIRHQLDECRELVHTITLPDNKQANDYIEYTE